MLVRLLHFSGTFALSLGLAAYLTPRLIDAATRIGAVDRPDGRLKQQRAPVPYFGGIAVYIAFIITLGMVFEFESRLLGLLLGASMIAMLGLFDDLRALPPWIKIIGQTLAIWMAYKGGVVIEIALLPPWAATLLTFAWLLTVTNAFNLIDVADALAGTVACTAGIGLFIVALLNHNDLIATAALALVGSIAGFLRYNRPPARIYLGDTGSLFIGFVLAALSILGDYTTHNETAALAPLALLAVPLAETVLLVSTRLVAGRSPFKGSLDHFAVRLRHRGWAPGRIATYAAFLGFAGVCTALLLRWAPTEPLALGIATTMTVFYLGNLVWWWCNPAPTR